MSGIKLEVTANNSAPVLEDSFETLNENVGNIDYIVVDGTIATVFLKGPMQIPTRKVYIYGVPTYLESIIRPLANLKIWKTKEI